MLRSLDVGCAFFFLHAARCQAAWAGQWVGAAFSNAPRDIRRTCSTSRSTPSRSLTLTRTARPRTRNPIAASRRLTAAPPRRRADSRPAQVERPTSRRPRPRPVSSRHEQFARCISFPSPPAPAPTRCQGHSRGERRSAAIAPGNNQSRRFPGSASGDDADLEGGGGMPGKKSIILVTILEIFIRIERNEYYFEFIN